MRKSLSDLLRPPRVDLAIVLVLILSGLSWFQFLGALALLQIIVTAFIGGYSTSSTSVASHGHAKD